MLTEKRKSELESKAGGMSLAQIQDEYFKAKTIESENLVTRDNPGGKKAEELAECYLYGRGVAEDKERGFKLLLELRKHVSDYRPEGLYDLALCFENGWGTEKDPDLAFLLYKEYVSKIIGFRNWLHKDWVLNAYEKMRELDPKQRAYERFRLDLSAR